MAATRHSRRATARCWRPSKPGTPSPLFNKLAVGRWQHTGFWRAAAAEHRFDEAEGRILWRFTLRRAARRVKVS